MDILLPQAYLIGLIVLLGGAAVVIGFQLVRVRRDEAALSRLEGQGKGAANRIQPPSMNWPRCSCASGSTPRRWSPCSSP